MKQLVYPVSALPAKKAYRTPRLNLVGRVKDLTLKVGSLTDSGQAGQFN